MLHKSKLDKKGKQIPMFTEEKEEDKRFKLLQKEWYIHLLDSRKIQDILQNWKSRELQLNNV